MQNKTIQILDAATTVFVQKGFTQATTIEIAKQAEVAEVTLYRKFSTKQKLFEAVISRILTRMMSPTLQKMASEVDSQTFISSILHDRLLVISQNKDLVKLLITESMLGNLPEEMDFTKEVFRSLESALHTHYANCGQPCDAQHGARFIGSLLLGYAILPSITPFHLLSKKDQNLLVDRYVRSFLVTM